jgi:hypothetical protein
MEFPWEEHYSRLIAFAEWVIQGKHWNSNTIPKGQTAESIVRDTIAKVFSEDRNWDPDRGDLIMYLKWVIRSEISHLAESVSNRVEVRIDPTDENGPKPDGSGIKSYRPSPHELRTGSPEEAVTEAETEAEKAEIARLKIDTLLAACSGQPDLEEIVYAIVDGKCAAKPQELSEYLGRPVDDIYQNLRALRRRASNIRIEARNEQG